MRMKNKGKEMRDLAFIAIAIFMTILICVTTIKGGNLFGIVVSIMLLAMLCGGLGYLYCKYEDVIFVEKPEKEKKAKAKEPIFKAESEIFEKVENPVDNEPTV